MKINWRLFRPTSISGKAKLMVATLGLVLLGIGEASAQSSFASTERATGTQKSAPQTATPNWTTLTNAPLADVSNCMLLTDGSVMCQSDSSWFKLTPDLNGSYLNGIWTTLASLPSGYDPDAYASAVLADGRVVIQGGEYNNSSFALSNMGAVYDPVADAWTMLAPPTTGSTNNFQCIGDAPSTMLADGRLLIGSKLFQNLAVLNPSTLTWTIVPETGKNDLFNSEEGWTLLPDGSVFTLDVANAPAAQRLLIHGTTGTWYSAGDTLQDLHTPTIFGPEQAPGCPVYDPPGEIGPALLLPNGTVFAIGASGYTGIYTPPPAGSTATGSWAVGPSMPSGLNVDDGPAAMLPNGHVLFGGSPGVIGSGLQYFEFDSNNPASLINVPPPANASDDATTSTQLLVLPTGQVLFVDNSTTVQLYTESASTTYNPVWAPAIAHLSSLTLSGGATYQISGTQFNGLSQGSAFGDESQNATNYPLVRITNNATGHVFYARTHGHSSMGVATGSAIVSTNFDVPLNIETGASTLQVVANGIPSVATAVTVVGVSGTVTTATSSPNPSTFGQPVTFTSTTTSSEGAPEGTVTFTEGNTTWASNVPVNGSGQASFTTAALAAGDHSVTATFTGSTGWANSTVVAPTQLVNAPAPASAVYSGVDSSTQGSWPAKYGADGQIIANQAANPPSYATVTFSGDSTYTWAASTTDPRALQIPGTTSTRIASTYYSSTSYSINVNLSDGKTHRVALYLLDWDSTTRKETISILNASDNAVLDNETYSSFHNGEYASWNITGNVIIRIAKTGGSNAVVSGLFFDNAAAPPTASYVGFDNRTEGGWTGIYGADGNIIDAEPAAPPSYATVKFNGDSTYTWAPSTTDARALQTTSGASTRIASTYYSSASFTINVNLIDGNTHRIALYLLDWDTTARTEMISILNAATGSALDTEMYSGFQNGEYAVWNISGNVIIKVTKIGGANAVVSGLFFDPVAVID